MNFVFNLPVLGIQLYMHQCLMVITCGHLPSYQCCYWNLNYISITSFPWKIFRNDMSLFKANDPKISAPQNIMVWTKKWKVSLISRQPSFNEVHISNISPFRLIMQSMMWNYYGIPIWAPFIFVVWLWLVEQILVRPKGMPRISLGYPCWTLGLRPSP